MKISNPYDVPVYTIAGSSTARALPEWLARKRKRSLKNDPEYANRIELLQDFEFEEASSCIRVSEDGQWIVSTGTYKPQIHTHYLPHLSLSFSRHTSSLNQTFLLLSPDYSKSLHLQADRSLEFHTPQGCHYNTRIPRYGRDLKYDKCAAEALIPAVGIGDDGNGEVFRLNLEIGRFMRSYSVDVGGDDTHSIGAGAIQGGINTGSVNVAAIGENTHNLLAFGTSIGTVEFWDSRSASKVGMLAGTASISALEFPETGYSFAVGDSDGVVQLFDIRLPAPILRKEQGYGSPIQTLMFLDDSTTSGKILSADKRIIKIWDRETGKPWTSVEPKVDINCVAHCKNSGMILTANEGREQHAFFIPQLGPAPRWCSFLDNVVEEMAEDSNDPNAFQAGGSVYDNYKFLTMEELKALSLDHLIGTPSLLRPYMHGFFIAQQLYEQARLIADPYVLDKDRTRKLKPAIDKEQESAIKISKKSLTARVNKALADDLLSRPRKGGMEDAAASLQDERFAQLFQDDEFVIDEHSTEYSSLYPNKTPANSKARITKTAVEIEAEESRDLGAESSDDEDYDADDANERSADESETPVTPLTVSSVSYKKTGHKPQQVVVSSSISHSRKDRSFGKRVVPSGSKRTRGSNHVGEKQVTFTPKPSAKPNTKVIEMQRGRSWKERRSASGNTLRSL